MAMSSYALQSIHALVNPDVYQLKQNLHFLGWLRFGDVWLESKTLVLNVISNTWFMPYILWGVSCVYTSVKYRV
jgi:hypothetical protein